MKLVLSSNSYKSSRPKPLRTFSGLLVLFFISSSLINECLSQDSGYLKKAESYIYSNKDSALFYIEKEIAWAKKNKLSLKLLEALSDKSSVASYYGDLIVLQKSVVAERNAFNNISDTILKSEKGFYFKCKLAYDQGLYYYKLNDFNRAKKEFFKLTDFIESSKNDQIKKEYNQFATVANSYLALMYTDELKYEVAEEFHNENLRLHELHNDPKTATYDTKNLIAGLKLNKGELELSAKLCKESIFYYNEIGIGNQINSFISTSQILIESFLKLGKLDSAQYYINKTKLYLEKRKRFVNSFNRLEADLFTKKGQYELAEATYKKILNDLEASNNNLEQTRIFKRLGALYEEKGNLITANSFYLKGINHINNQEEITATHLLRLVELLAASNKILSFSEDEKDLELTINQGQKLVNAVDSLKVSFINDSDKQNLINASISGIEYSLKAVAKMYAINPNSSYVETAFNLIEKSKNNILLDALTKTKASNYSGIPAEKLEDEKRLKVTINNLQRDRTDESKSALFEAKQEYKKLIDEFETKYPKYYQLKYSTKNLTIQELKEQLPKNSLFLNFFSGNEHDYVVGVSKENTQLIRIQNTDSLNSNVLQLTELLADPKSSIASIKEISKNLYNILAAPLLNNKLKHIIIAADGPLHYLPFEVLHNGNQYLIEQYSLSYVNSANLLSELKSKPSSKNNEVLAFAPNFPNSSNNTQLRSLPNNKKEVASILDFFNGKALTNKEASLANFRAMLNDYSIIHLATHAIVDNDEPEYSYLAFSNKDDEESTMYVNDLYTINMNANLVTLSACETGLGKLQKGEGMISLSRAFFYAGASSIAHTLWKVNDNASSKVMEGFYKELADSKTKDEALRNAKLNFINANNDNNLSHPYYWAGFVISGDTTPVTSSNKKWGWFILMVPIFLLLARRKIRKKKAV